MYQLNRRRFIRSAGALFGSVLLFPSCLSRSSGAWRFFTPEEALCIIAFCEQIIPKDESPGATDAGVIYYIDRQLSSVFHYDQAVYRIGIRNLQAYCMKNNGKQFEALPFEQQTGILQRMESGDIGQEEWPDGRPGEFFNLVRNHTMQGFYGSPIHGGNKDYLSFEMIRIDFPLVIGQNRYRG